MFEENQNKELKRSTENGLYGREKFISDDEFDEGLPVPQTDTEKYLASLDHGFMVRRQHSEVLGLSGSEMLVYALIESFWRETEKPYYGTSKHIADLTGYTQRMVNRSLSNLVRKGYIIRTYEEHYGRTVAAYSIDSANFGVMLVHALERRKAGKEYSVNHRPR